MSTEFAATSPSITFSGDDSVLAEVEPGSIYSAGSVSITATAATDSYGPVPSVINTNLNPNAVSVAVGAGSTIMGGSITVSASAQDMDLTSDLPDSYSSSITGSILGLLKQVPDLLISSLTGIAGQVTYRHANATVTLDGATVVGSDAVSIGSQASSNASFQVVSLNGVATSGKLALAIGYGQADATALTTVDSNSQIVGANAVQITSNASTDAYTKARTASNITNAVNNPSNVAIALAIANTNETSHVTIGQGSSVKSTNESVNIDAEGNVTNEAWAAPTINQDGTTALALAFSVDNADIKTIENGTIDAKGAAANTFSPDPSNAANTAVNGVDYTNSTIRINSHGFTDGQAVNYSNGGGDTQDIGGLTSTNNGNTDPYYVQVVDANNIQLATAPSIALGTYTRPAGNLSPVQTLGKLTQADWSASDVNTAAGTITLANLNGLTNGATVNYAGSSDATAPTGPGVALDASDVNTESGQITVPAGSFQNGESVYFLPGSGSVAPGTLVANHAYDVVVVDDTHITLNDPANNESPVSYAVGPGNNGQGSGAFTLAPPALVSNHAYIAQLNGNSVTLLDPSNNNAPVVFTSPGSGNSGLTFQTDILSFDPSTAVNSNNTITVPSTAAYATGDAVLYYTDPTIAVQQPNAPTETDFSRQIVPVSATTFELVGDQTAVARAGAAVALTFTDGSTANANVVSSSYSSTTRLTTVVLGSAVIGAAAPSEVDITLASGTAASYSSGIAEVADDTFTLPGDLTAVAPVGSTVTLTLPGGTVVTANIDSVSYQPVPNQTTIEIDQAQITGGAPTNVVVTLTAPVTATFTSQAVPIDSQTFQLTGDQSAASPVGSTVIVTFIDGSQATGAVASVTYDATANLTTVVLSSSVFGGLVPIEVSVASPTSGTVTAYDNPIPGLENGFLYYIVVIDATHIRLTLSAAAAQAAAPIQLTAPQIIYPQTYGNSTISLVGFQNGINVTANLTASNTINASATMSDRCVRVEDRRSPQRPLQHRGGVPAAPLQALGPGGGRAREAEGRLLAELRGEESRRELVRVRRLARRQLRLP